MTYDLNRLTQEEPEPISPARGCLNSIGASVVIFAVMAVLILFGLHG